MNNSTNENSGNISNDNNNNNNNNSDSHSVTNSVTNSLSNTEKIKSPKISGATVLAILRASKSGEIDYESTKATNIINNDKKSIKSSENTVSNDIEQMLRAISSGGICESQTASLLNSYGVKLGNYKRTSNIGELDANYLILFEVPRKDVVFVIENMKNIVLTVPTQKAPNWMVKELKSIYNKEEIVN